MTQDRQAGFTLIEVLIVLALMAILSGATLIAFGTPGRALQAETEAQLLANRLSLAAGEALTTSDQLSLAFDASGYEIERWSSADGGWVPHPSALLGARHELPSGLGMEVAASGKRVAIRPDGTGDPASVTITNASGGWLVSFDGLSARVEAVAR